jgi:hypothetical protein
MNCIFPLYPDSDLTDIAQLKILNEWADAFTHDVINISKVSIKHNNAVVTITASTHKTATVVNAIQEELHRDYYKYVQQVD